MNYIELNKQSFGVVARDYAKYRGSYNSKIYERMIRELKKSKQGEPLRILDLGCGTGNSTMPLYELMLERSIKVEITGCDPDPRMLREARKIAKEKSLAITYVLGSGEDIPFEDNYFDLIISGASFHWFANKRGFQEINRVLKGGGKYFIFWTQTLPSNQSDIGIELYREYGFKGIPTKLRDPHYVADLLTKNKFSNVTVGKLPFTETKTIQDTLGLIKTNSNYAILSASDKKSFMSRMQNEYERLVPNNSIQLKQQIYFCVASSNK
jgi:ubiquinone/menaquinone biosynthesis C-methylase UbiE